LEKDRLEVQLKQLNERIEAFQPKLIQLKNHEKALPLQVDYRNWKILNQDIEVCKKSIEAQTKKLADHQTQKAALIQQLSHDLKVPVDETNFSEQLQDFILKITDLDNNITVCNVKIAEKKELLNKLQDELQKEYMVPYKEFMQKFIQEDNVDFCKEAVELYVNEIIPKLKEIQSLKYGVNVVEYDNDTNTFHLIQRPNTLDSLEYKTNDDQITSFVKGVAYKKSSKKTQKADDTTAKNKTLKRKPVIEIEVVEDKYDVWEKAKEKLEARGALQRLNDLLPNAEQEVADAKDIVQKMTEDEYIEPDVFEEAEETLRKKVEELNRIKDEIKVKTEEKLANEEEELRIQKERREGIQIEREDEASRNIQQARKAREVFEKLQEQEKEYAEKDKFRRYEVPNILEGIISNVFEGKR
jgi:hypothetical protein